MAVRWNGTSSNPLPVPGAPRPVDPAVNTEGRIESMEGGGLELAHLWRYLAVATLVATCALIAAWSRVDLVKTSVQLDMAEDRLKRAERESERLELELATITDPATLNEASATLKLDPSVRVVDVPGAVGTP